MKLKRTLLMSAIITTVRLSAGFISNKVLAVFIGPGGIALIAQFQSFVNIVTIVATGAADKGVVKYSSELKDNEIKKYQMLSTALIISVIVSIICGLVIIVNAGYLSVFMLMNIKYKIIFCILGAVLTVYAFNQLLLSYINGIGNIKLFTSASLLGSIIGLILTCFLSIRYGISGAFISLVLAQSLNFMVTLFFAVKHKIIEFSKFYLRIDKEYLHKLNRFSLISITIVLSTSFTQIITRDYLMQHVSIDFAGYWFGMQRISDAYLMIIGTALATYYLPIMARLNSFEQICDELYRGYRLLVPIIMITAGLIYMFRHIIVLLLYSNKFLPMEHLFIWQFIGDIFKICGSMIAQIIMARSKVRLYIFSEILYNLFYILSAVILINLLGGIGSVVSFAITYFLYFLVLFFLFKKRYIC